MSFNILNFVYFSGGQYCGCKSICHEPHTNFTIMLLVGYVHDNVTLNCIYTLDHRSENLKYTKVYLSYEVWHELNRKNNKYIKNKNKIKCIK